MCVPRSGPFRNEKSMPVVDFLKFVLICGLELSTPVGYFSATKFRDDQLLKAIHSVSAEQLSCGRPVFLRINAHSNQIQWIFSTLRIIPVVSSC